MAATKTATREVEAPADLPANIRHVVRVLGPEDLPAHNVTAFETAERQIQENYLNDGWRIFNIIHLGTLKGREMGGLRYDAVQLLYILVK